MVSKIYSIPFKFICVFLLYGYVNKLQQNLVDEHFKIVQEQLMSLLNAVELLGPLFWSKRSIDIYKLMKDIVLHSALCSRLTDTP